MVLSRKSGERLYIGDNIEIVIHRIDKNRVSLGIIAPKEIRVSRGELTNVDTDALLKSLDQSEEIKPAKPEVADQFKPIRGKKGETFVKCSTKIRRSTDSVDQSKQIKKDGAA